MSNRRSLRSRCPAASTALPALLLLGLSSAGGVSAGVSSSSVRTVEIVVTASTSPAPAMVEPRLSR